MQILPLIVLDSTESPGTLAAEEFEYKGYFKTSNTYYWRLSASNWFIWGEHLITGFIHSATGFYWTADGKLELNKSSFGKKLYWISEAQEREFRRLVGAYAVDIKHKATKAEIFNGRDWIRTF